MDRMDHGGKGSRVGDELRASSLLPDLTLPYPLHVELPFVVCQARSHFSSSQRQIGIHLIDQIPYWDYMIALRKIQSIFEAAD